MKIDEAINFIENMMYLYRPTGEQHDKWCELLNLLRWYREQDLIKREDAIGEIEYECSCYQSEILHRLTVTDIIEQIPKAEPPFATDTNVGDKEDKLSDKT